MASIGDWKGVYDSTSLNGDSKGNKGIGETSHVFSCDNACISLCIVALLPVLSLLPTNFAFCFVMSVHSRRYSSSQGDWVSSLCAVAGCLLDKASVYCKQDANSNVLVEVSPLWKRYIEVLDTPCTRESTILVALSPCSM